MTISAHTVSAAPQVAETTDNWLAEYRRLLKNPAPGMLEMFQLLGQAAEIFHDTALAWSQMFPLPHRIRDANPYPVLHPRDGSNYWLQTGPNGAVSGPLTTPDDPGQGGLSVPRPPFQRDGDDTDG